MIRYHDFASIESAQQFLAELRAAGGLGYVVSMNADWHQVRELI